jgi:uncharacterized membrane protein YgcG
VPVLARLLVLIAALVLAAPPSRAAEEILDYSAVIALGSTDSFTVTEDITVRAEGDEIRRGIYRDFPLTFLDETGRSREVGFEVLSVQRGGRDEPWHSTRNRRGIRIYVGEQDVFLSPGIYSYRIIYRTSRQIRRFADYDELYWNVTGNDWIFPMRAVKARVDLPAGVRAIRPNAYTGRFGESGDDYRVSELQGGRSVLFQTTRTLQAGEGLTISVSLPKGVIAPPTAADEAANFFRDNRNEIVGGFGILGVLAYYLAAWWRVGRDPPAGVVIPLFSAPDGISPALANYVDRRGFSDGGWTALSAASVDLAVKGLLTFEDLDGEVRLQRTDKPIPAGLPTAERTVAEWLDRRKRPLTLSREDGPSVVSLGSAFRGAVERENRGVYFNKNRGWNVLGVLASVAVVVSIFVFGSFGPEEIGFMMPLVMGSIFLSLLSVKFGRMLTRSRGWGGKIGGVVGLAFLGLFALGIAGEAVAAFADLSVDPTLPSILAALVGTNVLFFVLMGAPTVQGRRTIDGIEGLRLYLSVAEAERMNMAGAPEVTPSRYEALLPYAIALGVEKPWSEALQAWLATSAAAGAAATYEPSWYHGGRFDDGSFADRVSSTIGSMSRSFESSVPPPKSSSSGSSGGGSSGGGGGGGGGGGW